ncbi:MAG: hypothetical protein ACRD4L_07285, partial [Pyrinomonadaceae bacterium]
PVMKTEAQTLKDLCGAQYDAYARSVPLFLPRSSPYKSSGIGLKSVNRFDLSLYMKYREYRAALGMVAAWTVLASKAAGAIPPW